MAEHYYTVGVHGAPTPETAPHGYMHRLYGADWVAGYRPENRQVWANATEWWPLPAPPTEQAPPPEPVARWTSHYDNRGMWVLLCEGSPNFTKDEAAHILKTLNTLDRDGVAWGPGRPMEELPDDGLVLVQMPSGVPCTFYIRKADYIATHRNTYECWWPLPRGGAMTARSKADKDAEERWNKAINRILDSGLLYPHMDDFWKYVDGEIAWDEFNDRMSP